MDDNKSWYNDDDFWETCCPILFSDEKILDGKTQVDDVIRLLDPNKDAKILDLCCGVGRHTLEFARRGYNITGLDRTEFYLNTIRDKAVKENLDINLIQADMRGDLGTDMYDLVINFNTSLGYFESEDDDKKVVENIYKSLKRDGVFLIDTMSKEIIARILTTRDWHREGDFLFLEERKVIDDWRRIEMTWTVIKDNKSREFTINFRIFSAAELDALLKSCGFGEVKFYGDLKGSPYDNNASRMIAVAKKI